MKKNYLFCLGIGIILTLTIFALSDANKEIPANKKGQTYGYTVGLVMFAITATPFLCGYFSREEEYKKLVFALQAAQHKLRHIAEDNPAAIESANEEADNAEKILNECGQKTWRDS